jgi:hypothetical protein
MPIPCRALILLLALSLAPLTAAAEVRTVSADGAVTYVEGSFADAFTVADPYTASFVYDTDETLAGPGSDSTPSNVPGHEYSSFWEFLGAPYGMGVSFPAIPASFSVDAIGVVVNDDLMLTADETNGAVSDGTYDWIELLGSDTVDICLLPGGVCEPDEFSPADGNEWTLAIIADPSWLSDGSVVPDALPPSFTALLVGIEFDAGGNETGVVFASATVVEGAASEVPALGALGLGVAIALPLLGLHQRRRLREQRTSEA